MPAAGLRTSPSTPRSRRQASRIPVLSGLLAIAAAIAPDASACRFVPDLRPLPQRLAEVPLAFVGTVTAADGTRVTFSIEQPLRGEPGALFTITQVRSTCALSFRAGDRWLYAGDSLASPSRWMGSATRPLAQAIAEIGELSAQAPTGLPAGPERSR